MNFSIKSIVEYTSRVLRSMYSGLCAKFDYLSKLYETNLALNWLIRHFVAGLVIGLGLWRLSYVEGLIDHLILMIAIALLGAVTAGLILFIYTRVKFTKRLAFGEDFKINSIEGLAFQRLIGNVLMYVGLIFLGGLMIFYSGIIIK